METCNASVTNMLSLHSKAQLKNLRLFLWNAPIDEGLFVFNITSLTTEKIIHHVIVRFELCYLYENKFLDLAIQVVMDAEVFGRKASGLLVQQVSDYFASCFRFCEVGYVDLGVVVFVADVVVDGHELEEKDVLSACRALSRIVDSHSFLHKLLEDEEEVVEDDQYQRIDETIVALEAIHIGHDDDYHGFHVEDDDELSENIDYQEEQGHEGRSSSDYDDSIIEVPSEDVLSDSDDYNSFLERLFDDDYDVDHNDVNYVDDVHEIPPTNWVSTMESTLDYAVINVNSGNYSDEENDQHTNIITFCSELEDVDETNADEFNHILNILRRWLHHEEEEHGTSILEAESSRTTESTKVSQDHSVRKILLKIKPTIELVNAKELTEDSICSICLEKISSEGENIKISRCKHVFHRNCIFKWLSKKQSCPCCRLSSLTDVYCN
ncbi:uncharacterized protein LOC104884266 [Beta vulgaris subsp. vulgaris]|uniref:uncharacterized protein LOC104884266 n=1 Tax=Beta vulgaris subsp. vulgaris TaxID=3555 RepID=UPI0005402372|nr:uncharacterized protein LOC104884266 [Beta vulgaris subsp. vulgaris]